MNDYIKQRYRLYRIRSQYVFKQKKYTKTVSKVHRLRPQIPATRKYWTRN